MRLRQYDGEEGAAYLELLDYPEVITPGVAKRTVDVHYLIEGYTGPRIAIDFNADGVAIGVEVDYSFSHLEELGILSPDEQPPSAMGVPESSATRTKMRLRQDESAAGAAYLELLEYPDVVTANIVTRSVDIGSLIEGYVGPRMTLDFNEAGAAVGIAVNYSRTYFKDA